MKLSEFIEITNKLSQSPICGDPEVMVILSQQGMPGTPCVKVKYVSLGFDWDHGKFMLRTEQPVVLKKNSK